MDTDVEVIKPLDAYLHHTAFAGFENPQRVQTGLLACEKDFPLFREFMGYYDTASFLKPDGSQDITTNVEILTALCVKHGLKLDNTYQTVDGFAVYPTEVFCPVDYDTEKLHKTRKTVVIHWFASSWHTEEELRILREEKLRQKRERNSNLRYAIGNKLFGEKGYEKLKSIIKRR